MVQGILEAPERSWPGWDVQGERRARGPTQTDCVTHKSKRGFGGVGKPPFVVEERKKKAADKVARHQAD